MVSMGASGESLFWIALMIVVREGTEAALIVAAIVAYLRRTGYDEYISRVRVWVNVAIVCCFLTAYVLIAFVNGIGLSHNQHIVKAIASLMAVAVLMPMCDWAQGCASASKWKTYINGMVHGTLVGGRRYALAMATFLAVYREGFEIILFYQALSADIDDGGWGEIPLGFSVGVIIIAAIESPSRETSLSRSSRSTRPLVFDFTSTISNPHTAAEAGLVPCALSGTITFLRCMSPRWR